ncbi:MAG: Rossmann-like and DUF2520 domain-containing protein [Dysgonomonas sp.]
MKIVCLGAGNVATHLVTALYEHSIDIVQVYSRTLESASALANRVGAKPLTDLKEVVDNADIYLFSLKDSVLENVMAQIPNNSGLWIHTAGSASLNIFSNYTSRYGVLYPFQTFTKNRKINWSEIPIFVEASDNESLNTINIIAKQLSNKIFDLSSEERKYLHLTGVFACNFTNHMYTLSKQFLDKINLPFDVVLPLIDETASKIHDLSPEEAQTGPAIRYDENVINKHLSLIEDDIVKQIYKIMSDNIHRISKE